MFLPLNIQPVKTDSEFWKVAILQRLDKIPHPSVPKSPPGNNPHPLPCPHLPPHPNVVYPCPHVSPLPALPPSSKKLLTPTLTPSLTPMTPPIVILLSIRMEPNFNPKILLPSPKPLLPNLMLLLYPIARIAPESTLSKILLP